MEETWRRAARMPGSLLVRCAPGFAIVENGFLLQLRKLVENRLALFLQAIHHERYVQMPFQRLGGTRDDYLGTIVATHEVERNS